MFVVYKGQKHDAKIRWKVRYVYSVDSDRPLSEYIFVFYYNISIREVKKKKNCAYKNSLVRTGLYTYVLLYTRSIYTLIIIFVYANRNFTVLDADKCDVTRVCIFFLIFVLYIILLSSYSGREVLARFRFRFCDPCVHHSFRILVAFFEFLFRLLFFAASSLPMYVFLYTCIFLNATIILYTLSSCIIYPFNNILILLWSRLWCYRIFCETNRAVFM